nr:unnamed protein product [Digitaria exilis]
MLVAGTRTKVDVLWQDGTRWRRAPSASLVYSARQNIHEFFPGQRVVYRPGGGDANGGGGVEETTTTATRVGVVRSLNFKDQTVRVSWPDQEADETALLVSTYDLGRSFDSNNNVFYGDVVVRRSTSPTTTTTNDDDDDTAAAASRTGGADDDGDVSWVGHVVDFCDDDTERVQVKWGDGDTSEVPFHEIAVVKGQSTVELLREIGKWTYQEDGEERMNSAPPPPPPPAAVARAQETNIAHAEEDRGEEDNNNDDGRGATTRIDRMGFVIQAVFRLGAKMLAKGRRYLPLSGSTVPPEAMPEEITAMESTTPGSGRDGHGNETSISEPGINRVTAGGDGSTTSGKGKVDAQATVVDDKPARFPLFEIVQSPPDHHYIVNIEPGTGGGRTSKWTKRVQKEWKILENDLPDTIYLRAFEDRMDLLRVAMVGASGTPYHDGLFFFDLQLPPLYPAAPPLVSYRSFGLRVNPNLYPSGTVCLSLLNTFGGRGSELWSPDASSLLQVVVSIQGPVLNAQPYYNESDHAAQAGTPEGRRNELPYSENAYLLTLQTMLHLLRRPPAGFEGLVRDHFVRRGHRVLRACRAYVVEGCPVGTLDGDGCPAAVEGSREERPCTMGFRLALTNVVPRLVEAFTAIGAQGCQGFHRLHVPLC